MRARIRRRLVIENDDRPCSLQYCVRISKKTELPVLFDVFHHRINGTGETVNNALQLYSKTWKKKTDGVPMARAHIN